jgi:hypothetical protein
MFEETKARRSEKRKNHLGHSQEKKKVATPPFSEHKQNSKAAIFYKVLWEEGESFFPSLSPLFPLTHIVSRF